MIRWDIIDTLSFALIILFINKSCFNLIIFPILSIFYVEANYLEDLGNKGKYIENCFIIFAFLGTLILYLLFDFLNCYSWLNWSNCQNRHNLFFLIAYLIIVIYYMMLAISTYKDYPIKMNKWKGVKLIV